ncbi:unnamed protein product [Cladocopium goreaui]|uniref:Cyclic nucleotide-binding domain-containing protein n=1 Tax=Cladocopium goreaui TaxID=2562237 RepID=A0A9P1DHC5_9DINO|nr:unnamed protein product [Cladocopium goreaui]|mmetsp:Transcript_25278/g.55133  ORF Transcript_25278/g.55133 Transcript_25278/m.55133 type:complete len:951 (-) Transcript_25278:45-2897(-)
MGGGASTSKYVVKDDPKNGAESKDKDDDIAAVLPQELEHKSVPLEQPLPKRAPAQKEEVLKGLDQARNTQLRALCVRVRKALAESAAIEQLPPGTTLEGSKAWFHGQCLVLFGQASVYLSPPRRAEGAPESVEVAVLKRGDSFGRQLHQGDMSEEDLLNQEAWENCKPRVVVPAEGVGLRICRLLEVDEARVGSKSIASFAKRTHETSYLGPKDEEVREQGHRFQGLHTSSNAAAASLAFLPTTSTSISMLAQLWLTSTPPPVGISDLPTESGGALPRAHFQAALWSPLRDRLDQLTDEIRRRQRAKYRIHDCFPLQGHQIVELKHHIMHLTELWYGSARGGNLSILYSWFVEAMEVLGVTAYEYNKLPIEPSPDGWAVVVDGAARKKALISRSGSDKSYVATGGVAQKQGRSAIDNTVLRNVFFPWEARDLLVGRLLRKYLSRLLSLRQRCILRRLAQHFQLDVLRLAQDSRTHNTLRSVLAATPKEEFEAMGLDPTDPLLQLLRRSGAEVAGFGQLDETMQRNVWEAAKTLLRETAPALAKEPEDGSLDVFGRFINWSRDYPGEFFEHDKAQHVTVFIAGMFSRRIVVVKRSHMERMTLARYFPLSWKRQQPLWGSASTGKFQVRPGGVKEGSHVRANECPYAALHGMSLSAGGFADQRISDRKTVGYTLLMELQWIRDPQANIENWYITDIEKIIQEAWQLNPHGPVAHALPGEVFVSVGQNPKVGSSIRQTQHTQLAEGHWNKYPILKVEAARVFAAKDSPFASAAGVKVELLNDVLGPQTMLEIVDICAEASDPENTGLMLRCRCPDIPPGLVRFLTQLRLRLLERLGGPEAIDFLVLCMSDQEGSFVVIFAPTPQLMQLQEGHADLVPWANPLTGESSEVAGIEESRLDFGKGVGHFLVLKDELRTQLLGKGEDTLRRIWAFNRVPGARQVIEEFIVQQNILET